MKIILFLLISSLLHVAACGRDAERMCVELLKTLEGLNAPQDGNRQDEISYDWNFLMKASPLLEDPLLLRMTKFLVERDITRYVAAKESIAMLDRVSVINPGSNLIFAWLWAPEKFEVASTSRESGMVKVIAKEKLESSKIYRGYEGQMKIDFVEIDGGYKIRNITFRREFTNGEVWESDLLKFLETLAENLKKRRNDAISKPTLPSRNNQKQVPPEVLKGLE